MAEGSFAEGLVGVVLDGRYRLDAVLGEGGMGAVFRAHHIAMDRKVAIKLLKPHLRDDAQQQQRFHREARSTLKVDSPHAVQLIDFGITPHQDYYMVLEYLDGRTVQRELDVDGPFAPARVVHIARQALHALAAAHRIGLVHRDIKPDNILLMRQGDDPDYAKLLDFGVAKLMEGAARTTRSALSITDQGMVFGTPEFMSPEQACGLAVDARSDLYSLAATMFGMLTGCAMFAGKSPMEHLLAHARKPPPHLADGKPELAAYPELDALLHKCFAKQREDRPQSADELDAALAALEPTLTRARAEPAASATVIPAIKHAPSGFVAAIPVEFAPTAASTTIPATTGAHVPPRRARTLLLSLGALAIVSLLSIAIYLATRDRPPKSHVGVGVSVSVSEGSQGPGSGSSQPSLTPTPTLTPTSAPPDAPVPVIDAPLPSPVRAHPNPDVATHLAAASSAQSSGNHLRQIAEADAALHLDPHNLSARLLLADGLLATGATDKVCQYIQGLTRNATAHRIAQQAGCPSD